MGLSEGFGGFRKRQQVLGVKVLELHAAMHRFRIVCIGVMQQKSYVCEQGT